MEKQRETPDAAVGNARINGTPIDRVVRHSGDYPNYISSVSRSTSCTTARRMRGRLSEGDIYRIRARARKRNSVLLYPLGAARCDGPYSVFARNHVPSARRGGSRHNPLTTAAAAILGSPRTLGPRPPSAATAAAAAAAATVLPPPPLSSPPSPSPPPPAPPVVYPTFVPPPMYSWRFALQGQQTSPR
ncbi:hypothetical protein ALC53_09324 [Atta colombica]|uniref:Uncharacterized protein n=1 Tax=Atta colombica TaxID=520822 RepID=A0A195B7K8_9HYME|nr:hypothetical protein ALC53_09324 [Atta colombica]